MGVGSGDSNIPIWKNMQNKTHMTKKIKVPRNRPEGPEGGGGGRGLALLFLDLGARRGGW
jgi:hypothetical protein